MRTCVASWRQSEKDGNNRPRSGQLETSLGKSAGGAISKQTQLRSFLVHATIAAPLLDLKFREISYDNKRDNCQPTHHEYIGIRHDPNCRRALALWPIIDEHQLFHLGIEQT